MPKNVFSGVFELQVKKCYFKIEIVTYESIFKLRIIVNLRILSLIGKSLVIKSYKNGKSYKKSAILKITYKNYILVSSKM